MLSPFNHRWERFRQVDRPNEESDCRFTSADATHLFLCGIVIGAPKATTLKISHEVRKIKLEARMHEFKSQLNAVLGDPAGPQPSNYQSNNRSGNEER